jgi:hypothetical protein
VNDYRTSPYFTLKSRGEGGKGHTDRLDDLLCTCNARPQKDGLTSRSLPIRRSCKPEIGSVVRFSPFVTRELFQPLLLASSSIYPSPSILELLLSKFAFHRVSFVAYWIISNRGVNVKQGYRLIIVDKAGVLVSEFQLTENGLAQPEAFVAAFKQSIEAIEEEP